MPALRREDLDEDPIAQFAAWFERAAREAPLPDAMTLATVDAAGEPDARMVLLKGVDAEGFRFFTNYESAKAGQLEAGGAGALVVYWRELDRQVRVRGTVERLDEAGSDAYFATRSRESRLGAWASPQSQPLDSREALDARVREAEARFRRRRGASARALGRLPGPAANDRVLAGPGRPPARPLSLHARRRGLADREARPVSP